MRETGNYWKQTSEKKSDIKTILCGSLPKAFSKGTAHESWSIPVSNLKTLRGKLIQVKAKNKLTRIILWIKPSQKKQQKLTGKTPKTYTKTFFTNCILKNNSAKTAFHTTVKNLRGECKKTMESIMGAAERFSHFPIK